MGPGPEDRTPRPTGREAPGPTQEDAQLLTPGLGRSVRWPLSMSLSLPVGTVGITVSAGGLESERRPPRGCDRFHLPGARPRCHWCQPAGGRLGLGHGKG